jgi:hypothetical protein
MKTLTERKWVLKDADIEYSKYEREFSGRMTPRREAIIKAYVKSRSERYHCGHQHDCCGCLCEELFDYSYKHNQVVITRRRYYNY